MGQVEDYIDFFQKNLVFNAPFYVGRAEVVRDVNGELNHELTFFKREIGGHHIDNIIGRNFKKEFIDSNLNERYDIGDIFFIDNIPIYYKGYSEKKGYQLSVPPTHKKIFTPCLDYIVASTIESLLINLHEKNPNFLNCKRERGGIVGKEQVLYVRYYNYGSTKIKNCCYNSCLPMTPRDVPFINSKIFQL